jgi:hypothetical protein
MIAQAISYTSYSKEAITNASHRLGRLSFSVEIRYTIR